MPRNLRRLRVIVDRQKVSGFIAQNSKHLRTKPLKYQLHYIHNAH